MRKTKIRQWDGFAMDYEPMIPLVPTASVNKIFGNRNIMFYIGAKDKNGKEIYEEDILSCKAPNFPTEHFVAVWHQPALSYKLRSIKDNQIYSFNGFVTQNHIEIVGNTYENSELLEGTNEKG